MKTNTIRHKIVGDTTIDEDTELHGMIAGTVTVAEDTILQLHGKVAGSLILLPRSAAFVHGTVDGNVVNRGGYLEIFGAVTGQVVRQAGTTVIDSMAEVGLGVH